MGFAVGPLSLLDRIFCERFFKEGRMTLPKISLAAATILFLSSMVFGSSITVDNTGGTFSQAGGGISLSGATITLTSGLPAFSGTPNSLNFSLGTTGLSTGTLFGITFKSWTGSGLGSFTFATSAFNFSGSFNCATPNDCLYHGTSATDGTFHGVFSGLLTFTAGGSQVIKGFMNQTFNDPNVGTGGHTEAAAVPEIGTLGLVGVGLIGIAGFTKRKFTAVAG